jgi:hypothetical protein
MIFGSTPGASDEVGIKRVGHSAVDSAELIITLAASIKRTTNKCARRSAIQLPAVVAA